MPIFQTRQAKELSFNNIPFSTFFFVGVIRCDENPAYMSLDIIQYTLYVYTYEKKKKI